MQPLFSNIVVIIMSNQKYFTMKSRLIILSLFIFCMLNTNAQISFGIRGGVNSSNIKLNDFSGGEYKLEYNRGALGFHIGGIAQIELLNLFIQPELLYTQTKNDVSLATWNSASVEWGTPDYGEQKFSKIDIPIIAGMKFGPLKLQVGPVATMMLMSKSDLLESYDIVQEFSTATLGYQAGVGLELTSLLVDVKYEGNLSKLGDGVTIAGHDYNFDQRMSQWILSVGFLF
jgi:hypothetical protein